MTQRLTIQCRCGALTGEALDVDPTWYGVCYCADCQAFARALRSHDTLDEDGGTAILQMGPSHVRFTAGVEHLACLRLGPKGLMRWYAGCCDTPIGNTLAKPGLPFVGLIHDCWTDADGRRAKDVGPASWRVNAASALTDAPSDEHLVRSVWRAFSMMAGERLSGRYRNTPFFDAEGRPIVEPRVLSKEERAAASTPGRN